MPERHQGESISRTLLLPREHHLGTGSLGTFRLRYILAEDGCKESQVALAKSLLTNPSDNSEERSFNAQLAVYWLLQAAKKGQDEAFLLLRDCSSSGVGINARNNSEIEKCLRFSEEEKISRRVAFAIFRAIMSDTEDLIPEDIFREKIDFILKEDSKEKVSTMSYEAPPPLQKKADETGIWNQQPLKKKTDETSLQSKQPLQSKTDETILRNQPQQKKVEETSIQNKQPLQMKADETSLRNQAHISFNEVVSSVQSCLEGNVPLVSLKQVTHYNEYKKWLSTKYLHIMWDLILRSAEGLIHSISSLVLSLSMLFLCILLKFAEFFSSPGNEISNYIRKSMLFVVILFCLLAMISSTCFVVQINFGGDNLKKWLHLIKFFEPNIRSEETERKYVSKTTFPLVTFFFISFLYMALVPLSSTPMISTDVGVLSLVLMLFVDRTISQQRYYVNISLVLNALTCLYKANLLQSFFANSLSYLNFTITYDISENVHMHLSFISCIALPFALPYLYVKMALGQHRGWHLVLLPHLMSLTWMNLACIHLADATSTYQLFSLFSWLVILISSKYIGVLFTFALYLLLKGADQLRIEIFLLVIVFVVLYSVSLFFVKRFKASYESRFWSSVMCFAILMLSYQTTKPADLSKDVSSGILPWDKYQTYCHHHAWYRSNTAEVQISCLPLKGREISMEGTITDIDVIQVHNNMELIANVLPEPLQSWFVCAFGKNYASCDSEGMTPFEKERCHLYETLNLHRCHLHNWDVYKYQIILEVFTRASPEVTLFVNHVCSEFVKNLKEGDSLQVVGALESNIGGSSPKFILRHAKCISCYTDFVCKTSTILPLPDYRLSLRNLVWLYFAPILQYEPK